MDTAPFHPFAVSLTLREKANFYNVDVPLSQLGKNINLLVILCFGLTFLS
jgi:hypothetical protein